MNSKVHVIISGKVQGVWFRANTKQKAEQLGLTGWVRNTSDGKVEAVFEGDKKLINEIVEWCNQGPPLAEVDNVDISYLEAKKEFNNFTVKY